MRERKCKIFIIMAVLFFAGTYAFAEGLGGWVSFNRNIVDSYEEGDKVSSSDSYNRNFNLSLQKTVTPMLNYRINLRANMLDSDSTNESNLTTETFQRRLEPALDLSLNNAMYSLGGGYRRQEQWESKGMHNEDRKTKEFYYSTLSFNPDKLPSLSLNLDRQQEFDYLTEREMDRTTDSYSISSSYDLPSRVLSFNYSLDLSNNVRRTPLERTEKRETDNFNGSYRFGYRGNYLNKKATYSMGYQGNYAKSKTRQFVSVSGSFINQRISLGGLYGHGSVGGENVDILTFNGALVEDYTVSTGIEIGNENLIANKYHNLGIFVSAQVSVDRLYIYVNKDVTGDGNLTNLNNWKIFKSDYNQADTWEEVPIRNQVVRVSRIDAFENIYRYEIEFSTSHNASFFKAVNRATANIPNVSVTMIEALGTDDTQQAIDTTTTRSFNQGLNFSTNIRALPELIFALNYSLDRTDQNPISFNSSVSGAFENIFTDSIYGDEEDFRSNITRSYGLTTTWLAHTLLTTNLRLRKSENFDNLGEVDSYSNTYNLSFNSVPLPTLDSTLSLIRSDRYNFNEKQTTSNSAQLSVGSRLYSGVNMINDLGYTESKSYTSDTTSDSYSLTGSLDAGITKKLSGILNYGYYRTLSGDESSTTKDLLTSISYQPGRYTSISANFSISDNDGDQTVTEGVLFDWLPLRVFRLNLSYQHSDVEPGPSKNDTINGYAIWYITKFADLRFAYGYTQRKEEVETESYSYNSNLNCRF